MSETPKKIDEPFGSDDEDFSLMHKEWSKVDGGMKNAGMRNGLESSQDHILQEGFNSAFRDALHMAMSAGRLQGSISALLSCPSPAVKGEGGVGDESEVQVHSESETHLQELLTKNTSLLSAIPHILQTYPPQDAAVSSGNLAVNKLMTPELGTMASGLKQNLSVSKDLEQSDKEGRGEGSQSANRGCEEVCSNRRHFWSQLESFRMQAGPLGIFTGND